jgi:cell division septation protein DedD
MILGGLAASVALAALIIWLTSGWTSRSVPLIEADPRPFKIRPDSAPAPSGQQELIFERGARPEAPGQARLAPGPEQPRPEGWRQPPAPARPATAPAAPPAGPVPAPAAAATPAAATTARPATAPGRTQIQLGALRSEEAARAEWERLRGRVPELASRTPAITRFEREGQAPLWRLRVGGLADRDAARTLCEQVQTRGGTCAVVGG